MSRTAIRLASSELAFDSSAVLVACGSGGLGPWQEDVRLSDGRLIVVERYEESGVHGPIADADGAFLTRATHKVVAPVALTTLPILSIEHRPCQFPSKRRIPSDRRKVGPGAVGCGPHWSSGQPADATHNGRRGEGAVSLHREPDGTSPLSVRALKSEAIDALPDSCGFQCHGI